jgi:4-hydroxyphenylacetate 3-monooxygenase
MRSGREYLASLRDGRRLYVDGELIQDVTVHPGFAAPVRTIAGLYDAARHPANVRDVACHPPDLDGEVNAIWLIPRSREDLDATGPTSSGRI